VELTVSVALITLGPLAVNVMLVVLSAALRPAGADMERVTVPVKPFTALTLMVAVPGSDGKKSRAASCHDVTSGPIEVLEDVTAKLAAGGVTVTDTVVVLESVFGAVPVVPVMVRVKVAGVGTAVQLTVKTVPETLAVQPVGAALVEKATVPENPLIAVDDRVEVWEGPVAIMVSEDGLAETEKSWTVTEAVVDLDNVFGAVPVVPVTGTVNEATPVAQVTDRTAPVNEAVQPEGTAPAENVTDPANPLIAVATQLAVPGTVARVVIDPQAIEKSTTWNVTEFDGMFCTGVPPLPVTVAV
jgi:hypothetical protein